MVISMSRLLNVYSHIETNVHVIMSKPFALQIMQSNEDGGSNRGNAAVPYSKSALYTAVKLCGYKRRPMCTSSNKHGIACAVIQMQ